VDDISWNTNIQQGLQAETFGSVHIRNIDIQQVSCRKDFFFLNNCLAGKQVIKHFVLGKEILSRKVRMKYLAG
jgi:hypothetical protein